MLNSIRNIMPGGTNVPKKNYTSEKKRRERRASHRPTWKLNRYRTDVIESLFGAAQSALEWVKTLYLPRNSAESMSSCSGAEKEIKYIFWQVIECADGERNGDRRLTTCLGKPTKYSPPYNH